MIAHHLLRVWVAHDGRGQSDTGGALARGVHRTRRDVRDVPQQLRFCDSGVACTAARIFL